MNPSSSIATTLRIFEDQSKKNFTSASLFAMLSHISGGVFTPDVNFNDLIGRAALGKENPYRLFMEHRQTQAPAPTLMQRCAARIAYLALYKFSNVLDNTVQDILSQPNANNILMQAVASRINQLLREQVSLLQFNDLISQRIGDTVADHLFPGVSIFKDTRRVTSDPTLWKGVWKVVYYPLHLGAVGFFALFDNTVGKAMNACIRSFIRSNAFNIMGAASSAILVDRVEPRLSNLCESLLG